MVRQGHLPNDNQELERTKAHLIEQDLTLAISL